MLPLPAMLLLLIGGIALDRPVAGSIAAGAAFSIGMGATRRIGRRRWNAMAWTGLGMVAMTLLGTLCGRDLLATLAFTAAVAASFGAAGLRSGELWWAWLQFVVAALIATHYPSGPAGAVDRAALVALGMAVQIACVAALVALFGDPPVLMTPSSAKARPAEMALHALRAAICVVVALLASGALELSHGYWAAMTAAIVLKPGLRDTGWRGLERVCGTTAGIVVATLAGLSVHRTPMLLAILTAGAAAAAGGLQRARYAVVSGAITPTVLLMATVAGEPIVDADAQRLLATLLGGAIALAGAAIAPRRPFWRRTVTDQS